MHYPGERCLPGPKFLPEFLPPCQAHPEPFANTCHPLSITKGPAPRWGQSCAPAAPAVPLLPCAPLVQRCLLLYPEPCETTRLLPGPRVPAAPPAPRSAKIRAARSLPPCAPRCPEPGRLRFPPCGIRGSSASCRAERRPRKAARVCPALPRARRRPLLAAAPRRHRVSPAAERQPLLPARGGARAALLQGVPHAGAGRGAAAERHQGHRAVSPRQGLGAAGGEQGQELLGAAPEQGPLWAPPSSSSSSPCPGHPETLPAGPGRAKRSGHAKKSRSASKWLW
ncbi:uncharacterized protein GJ701_015859 [Geothlypis trichas]